MNIIILSLEKSIKKLLRKVRVGFFKYLWNASEISAFREMYELDMDQNLHLLM